MWDLVTQSVVGTGNINVPWGFAESIESQAHGRPTELCILTSSVVILTDFEV